MPNAISSSDSLPNQMEEESASICQRSLFAWNHLYFVFCFCAFFICPKRSPSSSFPLPSYNGSLCLRLRRSIFFEGIPLTQALSFSTLTSSSQSSYWHNQIVFLELQPCNKNLHKTIEKSFISRKCEENSICGWVPGRIFSPSGLQIEGGGE